MSSCQNTHTIHPCGISLTISTTLPPCALLSPIQAPPIQANPSTRPLLHVLVSDILPSGAHWGMQPDPCQITAHITHTELDQTPCHAMLGGTISQHMLCFVGIWGCCELLPEHPHDLSSRHFSVRSLHSWASGIRTQPDPYTTHAMHVLACLGILPSNPHTFWSACNPPCWYPYATACQSHCHSSQSRFTLHTNTPLIPILRVLSAKSERAKSVTHVQRKMACVPLNTTVKGSQANGPCC